ncbi:hypothetical protein MH1LPH_07430 [Lactiplantibacillus brownii]
MRSGDLPERYGAWQTVYSRFHLWVESGFFERIFEALIDDPDMENLSLDSTIVRAHQKATGAKKRQMFGLSNPGRILLTGGQVHDSRAAQTLLASLDISESNVIAYKAYGTAKLRQYITAESGAYTIPPKENAKNKWHVIIAFILSAI